MPLEPDTGGLLIEVGELRLVVEWHPAASRTVEALRRLVPLDGHLLHVRWSGEAVWLPLGARDLGVGYENATSHPAPGEVLIYAGPLSECELLIPYGACSFASRAGPLAGNHVATVVEGRALLAELGRRALWNGAQQVRFTALR